MHRLFILLTIALLSSCGYSPVAAPNVSTRELPKIHGHNHAYAFQRTIQTGSDTFIFQTGCLLMRKPGHSDIDLVGAVHAGEQAYYRHLTKELGKADLVLFEGVTDTNGSTKMSAERRRQLEENSAYGRIARSIGLVLQSQHIPYTDRRYRNCDMTVQQMQALLSAESDTTADATFSSMRKSLSGKSLSTNMTISLIGSSHALSQRARFMLVASGGSKKHDATDNDRLNRLILEDRNNHVMQELRKNSSYQSHRRIALFYGSAHLGDLRKKLESQGYRAADSIRWINAIHSHPYSSGITHEEVLQMLNNQD